VLIKYPDDSIDDLYYIYDNTFDTIGYNSEENSKPKKITVTKPY
jgi:hypothetical protein